MEVKHGYGRAIMKLRVMQWRWDRWEQCIGLFERWSMKQCDKRTVWMRRCIKICLDGLERMDDQRLTKGTKNMNGRDFPKL